MARRRRGLLTRLVVVALVISAILVGRDYAGLRGDGEPVRVVIPRGATTRAIAESLHRADVVGMPRLFRYYASVGNADRAIKPGTYRLTRGASWRATLETLVGGKSDTRTVVIPEGFDLRAIAPTIAKALDVPEDSVVAAAADTAWRRKLQVPTETLEGYLFPATYTFASGTSAREAVDAMIERYTDVWTPAFDSIAQTMSVSQHDVMTMASIVEKEARKPEERPIIAAVYWNRVKKGMRLQADPTVQYALPKHTTRVLYKDLETKSPYNTYQNDGLPPGPIASPGEASIVAALNPAKVPYLYFVAAPDGHHEFRTTFAEHQRAVTAMRAAARRAAQSAKTATN